MGGAKVDHCSFLFNLVQCYYLSIAAHFPPSPIISLCTWALNTFSPSDVFHLEYLCSVNALGK